MVAATVYGIGFDLWTFRETVVRGNWSRTYFGRGVYRVQVADTVRALAGRTPEPVVVGWRLLNLPDEALFAVEIGPSPGG